MKKMLQRWMGLLLVLCLLALPVFASFADEEVEQPQPTEVPATTAPTPVPTPEPTEEPTPEPATPEPTAELTAVPEVTNSPEDHVPEVTEPPMDQVPEETMVPMAMDEPMAIDVDLPYTIEGNVLTVEKDMTVTELATVIAEQGSVAAIIIAKGAEISGAGNIALAVQNDGTISGGTFTKSVQNYGTISGGSFDGQVQNFGTISGGTFTATAVVNNGTKQYPTPDPKAEPTPTPNPTSVPGTITGGTFEEKSTLNNYWDASKAEISGTINAYYKSEMKDCTYGDKAAVGEIDPEAVVQVKYKANGREYINANYGDNVLEKLEGISSTATWYWYEKDSTKKTAVKATDTFGLKVLNYVSVQPTPIPSPTPTATIKPTSTSSHSGGSSSSKATATPSPTPSPTPVPNYSWESSLASDGEVEEEEELGYDDAESELIETILQDGDRAELGIVSDEEENGAAYELIVIPGDTIEPEVTPMPKEAISTEVLSIDALNAAEQAKEVTEAEAAEEEAPEEDDGLIPGEVGLDELVPGMVFVRAKGLGTEARTLTLTLSQIKRMAEEQGTEVLIFRNGSATVSLNTASLLEGNVLKLIPLMQAWAYNGTDFAEYDLAEIDFDSLQTGDAPTDEELREFQLKLTISPAIPVGYDVRAELWLGESFKEISLLLDKMGITLHAQTATQDVSVYYLNEAQERFMLESHRGVVPGGVDTIEGYEVVFTEDENTVMKLARSIEENEFEGLCARTGDAGTYYIGILPTT